MHLDSTFLGVHLDSTFLGVHLDSTSLGVHLDSKAVQEQQQSTGHGNLQERQLLLSKARTRAAGDGEVKTGEEELLSMQEPR